MALGSSDHARGLHREKTRGSAEGKSKGGLKDAAVCSMLPDGRPQGACLQLGKAVSWTPPYPHPHERDGHIWFYCQDEQCPLPLQCIFFHHKKEEERITRRGQKKEKKVFSIYYL